VVQLKRQHENKSLLSGDFFYLFKKVDFSLRVDAPVHGYGLETGTKLVALSSEIKVAPRGVARYCGL